MSFITRNLNNVIWYCGLRAVERNVDFRKIGPFLGGQGASFESVSTLVHVKGENLHLYSH
jgi:hypothetical protein